MSFCLQKNITGITENNSGMIIATQLFSYYIFFIRRVSNSEERIEGKKRLLTLFLLGLFKKRSGLTGPPTKLNCYEDLR
jgi:hypothetical protein